MTATLPSPHVHGPTPGFGKGELSSPASDQGVSCFCSLQTTIPTTDIVSWGLPVLSSLNPPHLHLCSLEAPPPSSPPRSRLLMVPAEPRVQEDFGASYVFLRPRRLAGSSLAGLKLGGQIPLPVLGRLSHGLLPALRAGPQAPGPPTPGQVSKHRGPRGRAQGQKCNSTRWGLKPASILL